MSRQTLNNKLLALGTNIWEMRGELDPDDVDYAVTHYELRMKAAEVLSASLLDDGDLKKYLMENIVATADELDRYGLLVTADYVMPRRNDYFRKNLDYGEGWHDMMDKYRAGKIKGVREWLEQKRKPAKKPRKKKSHHVISRGLVGETGYIVETPPQKGIDLGSSFGNIPSLDSQITQIFRDPKQAELQAEALLTQYERLRKTSKKKKKKDEELPSYPSPFDSYCDSERTRQYWMDLKDGEDTDAVEDFIDYIKEVKCPADTPRLASLRRTANSIEIEVSPPPPARPVSNQVMLSALPPREQMLRRKRPTTQSSIYRHLIQNPVRTHKIRKGDPVLLGDEIGFTGSTGRVTGPHLHVEQLEGKTQVDPSAYQEEFYPAAPGGNRVTSPFGGRIHPVTKQRSKHRGIDIGGVGYNTPIKAMSDGVVEFIGKSPVSGWTIKIRHYGLPAQGI